MPTAATVKVTVYRDDGNNNNFLGYLVHDAAGDHYYKADGSNAANAGVVTAGATSAKNFSFNVDENKVSAEVSTAFDKHWFGNDDDQAAQNAAIINQTLEDLGNPRDNGLTAIEHIKDARREAKKEEVGESTAKHASKIVWTAGFGAVGLGAKEAAKHVNSKIGKTLLDLAGNLFIGIGALTGLSEVGSIFKMFSDTKFAKEVITQAGNAVGGALDAGKDLLARASGDEDARLSRLKGMQFSPT